MTDPIASVAALPAPPPQRRTDPDTRQASAQVEAEAIGAPADPSAGPVAPSGKALAPVALSVDRDERGVFVYTLTDSGSGRVLAVIPRSAVVTSAQQPSEGVDIQA